MRLPETGHDRHDRSHDPRSTSELPSKLFFRIGEVAGLVGVEPHVLRYWEREFRSIRPTKSAKGQRVYSRKDVENLLRVRDLLYRDGFTIAGAKKRLQHVPGAAGAMGSALQASLFADGDGPAVASAERGTEADVDDDVASPEPESGPRGSVATPRAPSAPVDPIREKLTTLRAEVEGFLHELESERA